MKTIQLATAVLATLNSFATDNFSIFNITRAIRDDVDNGDYEITGRGTTVNHFEVRETFLELLDNALGKEYETKDSGRGYREFRKVIPTSNVTHVVATPFVAPAIPGGNAVQHPVTSTLVGSPASKWNTLPADVRKTIKTYLDNSGPVSLKRLQSRLKGQTYTCKDLYEYLDSVGLINKSTVSTNHSHIITL